MISIHKFTFNPFQENTYILSIENGDCFIIDPGCSNIGENNQLLTYIESNNLRPIKLLNTHCHIDHVMGNQLISQKFDLPLHAHAEEVPVLASGQIVSNMYGVPYIESPGIEIYLADKELIQLGESVFEVIHASGHSPGSVCFYNKEEKFLIGGDVLLYNSIGRTDLPLGHHDTLIKSIKERLFTLPDDVAVYSGHGPKTSIGFEKRTNPYLQ